MTDDHFHTDIARRIWDLKYRYREDGVVIDATVEDSWRRIARALAAAEPIDRDRWEARFYSVLEDFRFLPGGRIQAGAGTRHRVTLCNCFVMGDIDDSLDGICDALKEGALTMQQGGGVGYDFSTLRPRGTTTARSGGVASGPVSFMRIWDSMCATLLSTGARRGAMMATLRADHPDIREFIDAKRDPRELRHFNLSVQISDAFMAAVRRDGDWPLLFPTADTTGAIMQTRWSGRDAPVPCRVYERVAARALWDAILRANHDCAEPGVLFVDRINRANNLWYREHLTATNPCGEIPLPPYGACDLGAINLTRFVRAPFTAAAALDFDAIAATAAIATRLLDNVLEVSGYPLPAQAAQAHAARRIGLGLTGLADTLIMLGLDYASDAGRALAADAMRTICLAAYRTSIALAREKGAFPQFDRDRYLAGEFIRALPDEIRDGIARDGIRNSHLTTIAPAGTISLLADNVSSGVEPVHALRGQRRLFEAEHGLRSYEVEDYAYREWCARCGDSVPDERFVTAAGIAPAAHLRMQATLQRWVDNAIAKTINVPADISFETFRSVYDQAFDLGLKGCTTFRPNAVTGEVLSVDCGLPAG